MGQRMGGEAGRRGGVERRRRPSNRSAFGRHRRLSTENDDRERRRAAAAAAHHDLGDGGVAADAREDLTRDAGSENSGHGVTRGLRSDARAIGSALGRQPEPSSARVNLSRERPSPIRRPTDSRSGAASRRGKTARQDESRARPRHRGGRERGAPGRARAPPNVYPLARRSHDPGEASRRVGEEGSALARVHRRSSDQRAASRRGATERRR